MDPGVALEAPADKIGRRALNLALPRGGWPGGHCDRLVSSVISQVHIVLVVEDEPLIRMGIVGELEDAGFEVLEAANADDAILLLEAHPRIGFLFTDINMPGSMDGLKLAAAVSNRWPPVKIIITTGKGKVLPEYLPPGSRFLGKPYDGAVVAVAFREMALASRASRPN
jgi:CheY-like chemotaxis protein